MNYITQEETIERLCALVGQVGIHLHNYGEPQDCFCRRQDKTFTGSNYRMAEETIEFIENIVKKHLLTHKENL